MWDQSIAIDILKKNKIVLHSRIKFTLLMNNKDYNSVLWILIILIWIRIRIGEKRILPRLKIPTFFFNFLIIILKAMIFGLLFIYINKKSDLFIKII